MFAARRLGIVVGSLLLVVAILGYVIGHGHSAAASVEKTRSVEVGKVLVTAPMHWQPAASAPPIPGLPITRPAVLAPGGNSAEAGLITGQFAGREPNPLSATLLASLATPPAAEVVNLVETQAYRYSGLTIPGFNRLLIVYAIPDPGGDPTAVACYASSKLSPDLTSCDRIVATLTLINHPQSYDLTPEPGYANQVTRVIAGLDRGRVLLRSEINQHPALADVAAPARKLAAGYAHATGSLSVLVPPLVAGHAQVALDGALSRAHEAYLALAGAADARSDLSYNAARAQVDAAETGVRIALEGLAMLGYQ